MRLLLVGITLSGVLAGQAAAQTPCSLQGAWELVSAKYDNQTAPGTLHSMKMFSKTKFSVVGLDTGQKASWSNDTEELAWRRSLTAVGGSYTVSGDTWTESIAYATDPSLAGTSVTFTCRMDGDRLTQTGTLPLVVGGEKREIALEEVWKRSEP